MATIAILDYGFGNVLALETALVAAGAEVARLEDGRTLYAYDAAILPGVGRFGEAMRALESHGMFSGLWNFYEEVRKPILGIGLGMQMLASGSEEAPGQPGLNLLPGTARSMHSAIAKPSVGWHKMTLTGEDELLANLPATGDVHITQDYVILAAGLDRGLLATYPLGGQSSAAMLRRRLVWGIQFDPVKSGEIGQQFLQNFVALTERLTPAEPAESA